MIHPLHVLESGCFAKVSAGCNAFALILQVGWGMPFSCKQCFLAAWIPFVAVVFLSIPPAILLPFVSLYAPDSLTLLNEHFQLMIGNTTEPERGGTVRTKRGCTCQFPFDFGGALQYNCTNAGGEVRDGKGRPSLWCDTGPFCGQEYHISDKPFTNRDCCYDLCVDDGGETIRPNEAWHEEAKRITAAAAAAGTLPA